MSDISGQTLGRYRILERLGEGGMATVYKAYDSLLEREVALKIIRREAFPPEILHDVLKRFEREAKSLARLSHPSIVKVLDFGEHDGAPFLVLEYLAGGTLKQRVGHKIAWPQAVRLLLPIARGIEYAHHRGVIHRDIKPANILMTDTNEPTLSDFGIAKIFGGEQTTNLTGSGVAIGTPEYMAPEQWTGTTSAQSDIYSLGIVLYEMISGRKPYTADTPGGILIKQMMEPLPAPRDFVPDLPDAVEAVLFKALAKDLKDRYADMSALIAAMEALLAEAALTRPITTPPSAPAVTSPAAPPQAPSPRSVKSALPKLSRRTIFAGVGAVLIVIAGILGLPRLQGMFPAAPLPSATSTYKPTPILLSTPTPLPAQITDAQGVTMRLVPVGTFTMGSDDQVTLLDFYMDVYEVTNQLYKACVNVGRCSVPSDTSRFDDPEYANHPAVYVNWSQANAYCAWRGARLPTEAQWEKAARGTDGRTYPWGEEIDDTFANYNNYIGKITEVAKYEKGRSPYGMYDMAGNVMEWVSSIYKKYPYDFGDGREDLTVSGTRVLRGGSWDSDAVGVQTSYRSGLVSTYGFNYIGFRCARGTSP